MCDLRGVLKQPLNDRSEDENSLGLEYLPIDAGQICGKCAHINHTFGAFGYS